MGDVRDFMAPPSGYEKVGGWAEHGVGGNDDSECGPGIIEVGA